MSNPWPHGPMAPWPHGPMAEIQSARAGTDNVRSSRQPLRRSGAHSAETLMGRESFPVPRRGGGWKRSPQIWGCWESGNIRELCQESCHLSLRASRGFFQEDIHITISMFFDILAHRKKIRATFVSNNICGGLCKTVF